MVMLSFDPREKNILSQPEKRFSRVVICSGLYNTNETIAASNTA